MALPQHKAEAVLADGLGWFSIGLGLAEVAAPGALAQLIGIENSSRTRGVMRAFGAREIASGIGILSSSPHPAWLWARVAGDVLDIAALAAAPKTDRSGAKVGTAFTSLAGALAADVAAARRLQLQTSSRADRSPAISKAFTINRPPEEVAQLWNELSPLGDVVEHVRFDVAPGDRGTEVRVRFVPRWFGRRSPANVQEQLRQFKQLVETGEIARSRGGRTVREFGDMPEGGRIEALLVGGAR